jgi:hypothetical protein
MQVRLGEVSLDPLRRGLIPYWCGDPKGGHKPINAKCEMVRTLTDRADVAALGSQNINLKSPNPRKPIQAMLIITAKANPAVGKMR